jgi:hypothetical protein
MNEADYHTIVWDVLNLAFGARNVKHNVHLKEYDRFADFIVYTPIVTLAIEVENNADEFINGVGQAVMYSHLSKMSLGVVITPPPTRPEVAKEIKEVSNKVPIVHIQP